jgi:hypothetical protein
MHCALLFCIDDDIRRHGRYSSPRRQKHDNLSVTIDAQSATTGLHLLVDSTGIKMLGEGSGRPKTWRRPPSSMPKGAP